MVNYLYMVDSKEFVGDTKLQLDPLESEIAGEDIYIKIPNATSKAPNSLAEFEVNIYNSKDGAWDIVTDNRLMEAWYKEDATKVLFDIGDKFIEDTMTLKSPEGIGNPVFNGDSWEERTELETRPPIQKKLK